MTQTAMLGAIDAVWGIGKRHGGRAASLIVSYLTTSLVVLGAIAVVRSRISSAELHGFLSFLFISATASGLEPGGSKALLLRSAGQEPQGASILVILASGLAKSILASPAIAYIWSLTDPALTIPTLAWTLPIVTLGFWVTDLRVLLDWRGRHGQAIWAKQGGLAVGIVAAAAALLLHSGFGMSLFAAVALRALWLLGYLPRCGLPLVAPQWTRRVRSLLSDSRWMQLGGVSAIAALSGSADRFVALRYLPPLTSGGYLMLYEGVSKFWLLPYLAGPIIFARRVNGAASARVVFASLLAVSGLGVAFLSIYSAVIAFAPGIVRGAIGIPLQPSSLLFPLAIVISAATQILNADLQAKGQTRYVLVAAIVVLFVTYGVFWGFLRWGLFGLFVAWLIKSLVEAGAAAFPYARQWVAGVSLGGRRPLFGR